MSENISQKQPDNETTNDELSVIENENNTDVKIDIYDDKITLVEDAKHFVDEIIESAQKSIDKEKAIKKLKRDTLFDDIEIVEEDDIEITESEKKTPIKSRRKVLISDIQVDEEWVELNATNRPTPIRRISETIRRNGETLRKNGEKILKYLNCYK
jgi:hypothetical protein